MFDFPASPSTGQTFQPAGGPTYRWSGSVWSVVAGQFQGAMPSDNAPSSPVPGQLWWESDTGALFVFYDDGNSQQWVQISGPQPMPPNDGNEYTMVNGVWRLSKQGFDLAGKTQQDIPVPDWGPMSARLTLWATAGSSLYHTMRVSADGSTFLAGASDYQQGGFTHGTTGAFANAPNAAGNAMVITGTVNNATVPHHAEVMFKLIRPGVELCTFEIRGGAWTGEMYQNWYMGYVNGSLPSGIKAIRWTTSTAVAMVSGRLTVEWLP